MVINYNVSEKDYINFNIFNTVHSKFHKLFKLILSSIILLDFLNPYSRVDVSAEISRWYIYAIEVIFALLLFLILVVICEILIRFLTKIITKTNLKAGKRNDFIGPQTLTMHDEYMEESNRSYLFRIEYPAVERIFCAYNCFFIYIGANLAVIVPLPSFPDDSQKQEFISFLEQKTGTCVTYRKKHRKNK